MADTSNIDLVALIERHAPTRFAKAVGRGVKRTQKGTCPWCEGTDRFAVIVNEVPQHYYCGINGGAGCGIHGDAITFLREWLHMSYWEACEELGVDPGSEYSGPGTRNSQDADLPPSDTWQKRAVQFCQEAKDRLWSDIGLPARKWLYDRGFTDGTIREAGLGLNLVQGYQSAEEWGTDEDVYIARGIVIPYRVEGNLWHVQVRRSDKDIQAGKAKGAKNSPKYLSIYGGSDGLYGVDAILPDTPLVLCEGVFDALAFRQSVCSRASIVATGSTGGCHGEKWIEIIKQSPIVLGAFDYDENLAGERAFKFWASRIAITRLTPWAHDINDMLKEGFDINAWVDTGIELAERPQEAIESLCGERCSICQIAIEQSADFFYDDEGIGYCDQHWPVRQQETVLTREQIIERIAPVFGGCEVEILNCAATEYIAMRQAEIIQKNKQACHEQEERVRAAYKARREREYTKIYTLTRR